MEVARDTPLIRFVSSAMKGFDKPQAWLRPRIAEYPGVYQPRQRRGQMDPAVEVMPRRGGVAWGRFALLGGLIAPARGAIGGDQYFIDPARFGHFADSSRIRSRQHDMHGGHPHNVQSKPVRRNQEVACIEPTCHQSGTET